MSFKLTKSPGEGGLIAEFYQKFWYLVKNDFLEVILEIIGSYNLSNSQNRSVLSLLYKNGDRSDLKNWCPLTLLNVDYKIISKCLAERLKPLL
jgi:hypothetical protein